MSSSWPDGEGHADAAVLAKWTHRRILPQERGYVDGAHITEGAIGGKLWDQLLGEKCRVHMT